jgi:glutamine synthetase
MIENLKPTDPITNSAHDLPFALPRALDSAVRRLGECEALINLLGQPFVTAFSVVKYAEYEVFLQVISSWEREHLLLNV